MFVYKERPRRRLLGIPAAVKFARRKLVYDFALLPYAQHRHRELLRSCDRVQDWTYTAFYRSPAQLRLIAGPVMEFLGHPERSGQRLDILLLACSIGAEAYTIASYLTHKLPGLDFHIMASDLHQETIDRAEAAVYSRGEVLHCPYMTRAFVEGTFVEEGEQFRVRPEIRAKVSFSRADLLDGDGLRKQFSPAPVVVAQNVLFHLKPPQATQALANLVDLARTPGVLLLEGMDLDLREKLTAQHGLRPLEADLRRVYTETRIHTPEQWWRHYWGTEPFNPLVRDKARRYSTIYFKE